MNNIVDIRKTNLDLILLFVDLLRSNPQIIADDKLYNSIKNKLQILVRGM